METEEKTEELLDSKLKEKRSRGKKKNNPPEKRNGRGMTVKKTALIVAAVLLIAGGGYFGWKYYRSSQYQKELDLAVKAMDDGKIEDAILAYDNAIKIDDNRIDAYLGKAAAAVKSGDIDTARSTYDKLVSITGDSKYQRMSESAGMGNTSGNYANAGLAASYGDSVYVANTPRPGCLTKIDGSNEKMIFDLGDDKKIVQNISVDGDYVYFSVWSLNNDIGAESLAKNGIYRVPADGGDAVHLLTPTNDFYYSNMVLWNGQLYLLSYDKGIYKVDTNSGDMSTVFEGMYESLNSDGKYLYSGTDQSIYSIDSQGNQNLVTASRGASLIIAYQDKLYFASSYRSGDGYELNRINKDGSDLERIGQKVYYYTRFNIYDDTIYMARRQSMMSSSDNTVQIETYSLDGQNAGTLASFLPSDLNGSLDNSSIQYVTVNYPCVAGGKLYYRLSTTSILDSGYSNYFGSMDLDGQNNQIISNG